MKHGKLENEKSQYFPTVSLNIKLRNPPQNGSVPLRTMFSHAFQTHSLLIRNQTYLIEEKVVLLIGNCVWHTHAFQEGNEDSWQGIAYIVELLTKVGIG